MSGIAASYGSLSPVVAEFAPPAPAAAPGALLLLIPLLLVFVLVLYLLVRFRGYSPALLALGIAGTLTLAGHGLARLGDAMESNDALGGAMLAAATALVFAAAGLIHWMYFARKA